MKISLTALQVNNFLIHRDKGLMPVIGLSANGRPAAIRWEANPGKKAYLVYDTDRDAPVGFGVKVGSRTASFFVQRRIAGKVMKIKVGNTSDFNSVDDARKRARMLVDVAKDIKMNPKVHERMVVLQKTVADMTLDEAYVLYRDHLVNKAKPAKASSLKNLDGAIKRLGKARLGTAAISNHPLGILADIKVLNAFDTLAKGQRTGVNNPNDYPAIRTTAEQTFRWAIRVVSFVMAMEERRCLQTGSDPSLALNPLTAVILSERFRSKVQLEEDYEQRKVRNPMSIRDGQLGQFLEALMERRVVKDKRTACDYLLLTLLWGTRRGEAAPLMWWDMVPRKEENTSSFVDLNTNKVFFFDTKNRRNHSLPIAPAARQILLDRFDNRDSLPKDRRRWVFPARSLKAVQGHYLDSHSILKGIGDDAKLAKVRTHDLRRTFGQVAEEATGSERLVKRLLNHRDLRNVTDRYTEQDEERVREAMTRIERTMLLTSYAAGSLLLPATPEINTLLMKSKVASA